MQDIRSRLVDKAITIMVLHTHSRFFLACLHNSEDSEYYYCQGSADCSPQVSSSANLPYKCKI
jgi:hypothetical protein